MVNYTVHIEQSSKVNADDRSNVMLRISNVERVPLGLRLSLMSLILPPLRKILKRNVRSFSIYSTNFMFDPLNVIFLGNEFSWLILKHFNLKKNRDEEIIIQSFNLKEASALEFVYKEYFSSLCVYAFGYLKNKEDAKDTVQTVFFNFYSKISNSPHFFNLHEIQGYLYTSVKNTCLNKIKQINIREKKLSHIYSGNEYEESIDIQIIRDEILREIFRMIDKLPKKCKKIFVHAYIDGMSNKEIADKYKVSINTIKTQKLRAKKQLKNYLSELEFIILLNYLIGFWY